MEQTKGGRGRRFVKSLTNILIVVGIFWLGVQIGNGSISLQRNDPVTGSLPNRLNYDGVDQVYKSLKENFDGKLNQTQLEDGLKHGLAEATKDPYTVFFTAAEAREFDDQLNNSFSGIGAQLGQDEDGNIEIIAPIDGFPAEKAGLKAKDLIAEINGESTAGMTVDKAVSKIRGKPGTTVKLLVARAGKPLEFTITRQNIDLPSVKTKTLDGNIGYIEITTFAEDTTTLVTKAAQDFKTANVKGIVLDMRNNPGGLLDQSVSVSSLWLPKGQKILDEKRGGAVIDSYKSSGNAILEGMPTVVLLNNGSASASEIVAGALRDNKAASIVGEKSYGKGVVQRLINFADGSQLKVTVASWFRPSGQNINKKGITPDQIVKISDEDAKADKDTQLEAAQARLNSQIR